MISVSWLRRAFLSVAAIFYFAGGAAAQDVSVSADPADQPSVENAVETTPVSRAEPAPLVSDVEGITLGMTSEAVREKFGKPEAGDASSSYYKLDKARQLQLRFDGDGEVTMASMIYSGKDARAPEAAEVFGPGVSVEPDESGKVYKMVRYPAAGYWVAYSKIDLDGGPMTVVTIQELE